MSATGHLWGARLDSMTAELALLDVVRRVETAEARRPQDPMGVVRAG